MATRAQNEVPLSSPQSPRIRRGEQAQYPLNAAIIGGGKACYDLLRLLDRERLSRLNLNIIGVFDVNPEAPGLRYAEELNILATTELETILKHCMG
jgi:hypothetical protein